jgi:hypothetical protein
MSKKSMVMPALIVICGAAVVLGGAVAQAAQMKDVVLASNLKAPTSRQKVTPVPCGSVSSCNQIIAYCAANNGTWIESSHDGQGRPSGGTCYLD